MLGYEVVITLSDVIGLIIGGLLIVSGLGYALFLYLRDNVFKK